MLSVITVIPYRAMTSGSSSVCSCLDWMTLTWFRWGKGVVVAVTSVLYSVYTNEWQRRVFLVYLYSLMNDLLVINKSDIIVVYINFKLWNLRTKLVKKTIFCNKENCLHFFVKSKSLRFCDPRMYVFFTLQN